MNSDAAVYPNRLIKSIVLLVCLAVSLVILIQMQPQFGTQYSLMMDDFRNYWETVRLNLMGKDPFNPVLIVNPPWILTIMIPFGLFDYSFSRLLWLVTNIAIVLVCSGRIWVYCGGSPKRQWLAWIVAFIFSPTFTVFQLGQVTPLLLPGIVFFLETINLPKKWWISGASLGLIFLKPQLLYLFWIALLLWIVKQRAWQIIVWGAVAVAAGTLVSMVTNPLLLYQYWTEVLNYPLFQWATPTLGYHLQLLLGSSQVWLRYVPALVGIVWLVGYWRKHAANWNWGERLPYLILVSILTTPFAWTYDQVLLIIPMVQASRWLVDRAPRLLILTAATAYLIPSLLDLYLSLRLPDDEFVWLAPTFFLIYWLTDQWHQRSRFPVPLNESQAANAAL